MSFLRLPEPVMVVVEPAVIVFGTTSLTTASVEASPQSLKDTAKVPASTASPRGHIVTILSHIFSNVPWQFGIGSSLVIAEQIAPVALSSIHFCSATLHTISSIAFVGGMLMEGTEGIETSGKAGAMEPETDCAAAFVMICTQISLSPLEAVTFSVVVVVSKLAGKPVSKSQQPWEHH